jgi:uncharacterized protein (DUF885 family)
VWTRSHRRLPHSLPGFALFIGSVLIHLACSTSRGFPNAPTSQDQKLTALLSKQWEYELREDPQLATAVGNYVYNDRWKDYSLAAEERQKRDLTAWLTEFRRLEETHLSEEGRLNRTLMVRNLEERLTSIEFKNYEMPINPHSGVQLEWVELVSVMPFRNGKDYQDYISRLHRLPGVIDQVIAILQQGIRDGLLPPRYLLEKTIPQCQAIASAAGTANPFAAPLSHMPRQIQQAEAKRLRTSILEGVDAHVRPAYAKLAQYIATEYAPKGRLQPGIWALSNGDARYRFAIRQMTTTDLDPDRIHQIGLKEVARIEREQSAIAKQLGFPKLDRFRAYIKRDPKLIPKSAAELLGLYRSYIAQMEPHIPKLTHVAPKSPLEVRPMGTYGGQSAASARYLQGTADGSRPGILLANTGDLRHRTNVGIEATAYHEGIPGHHLQISIAQQLAIPAFRREGSYTAYTEGWALYAERLGKELGFYRDPYSDYGRLSNELLRAIRLVVDTGLHRRRWTRQQVVDFFHQHSSEDEPTVQSETDRYIAQPAQALAYKLGEQTILELRQESKSTLGPRFDTRAFHDEVLGAGSVPLDILRARVSSWAQHQASHP